MKVAPNVLISMQDSFFQKTPKRKHGAKRNKFTNRGLLQVSCALGHSLGQTPPHAQPAPRLGDLK